MRPFFRSALSNIAMSYANSSKYNTSKITEFKSCLINFDVAIIDGELFEKSAHVNSLYLGRWQSSATHHTEVAETKTLYGLKNMNDLTFLRLQGISTITELPSFISELTSLEILDLKACHNLEVIPEELYFGQIHWRPRTVYSIAFCVNVCRLVDLRVHDMYQ